MIKKRNLLLFARYTVVLLVALVFIVPFFWMIISSFKTPQNILGLAKLI